MAYGMIGNLLLSDVQAAMGKLMVKFASPNGPIWLRRVNRFLDEEDLFGVPDTFGLTTDGRRGKQFITHLESGGYTVSRSARRVLQGDEFAVTKGLTYNLRLIRGNEFEGNERTNNNVIAMAGSRGWGKPPVEVPAYLREMFSDKDLEQTGLSELIIMHTPIAGSNGSSCRLGLKGGRLLDTFDGDPDAKHGSDCGFLVLVPEKAA